MLNVFIKHVKGMCTVHRQTLTHEWNLLFLVRFCLNKECYNEDDESKEEDLKDEHGELYSEEDKGEELSRLEVSIRPRKLFHDNDPAGNVSR